MSSKAERDKQKQIQDRCQALLNDMLRDDDNKYCVDCDAKGPRWASWNLGIFLCIRCAGIHRNLGVHISKVKSVNLDTWTPEQVVSLQQMGNSRARAVYEANLPDNFRRPQTDSSLEAFIRAKYEQKKYIAREWVPPQIPKVNWDKELGEEAERQRRKKKEAKQQQVRGGTVPALPDATVPQLLPKPKGSCSPKPLRETKPTVKPGTQDLLGLDAPESGPASGASASNGDDIFCGFLSAPPAAPVCGDPSPMAATTQKAEEPGKGRSAEEESFFNQPAPSVQEKRQLTKDSILALYSTGLAPAQSVPQPMFGIPGGMYAASQPGFAQPAPAPVGFPVPNGMMPGQPVPPGVMQNGVFGGGGGLIGQQSAAVASNPFFSMVPPAAGAATAFHNMAQENPAGNSNEDLMLDFGAVIKNTQSAGVSQLPQQFARLNLAGPQQGMMSMGVAPSPAMGVPLPTQPVVMGSFQPAPPTGHTLATNLWQ